MTPRRISTINALTSLAFGTVGLIIPGTLAGAFGIHLDATGLAMARLACASYVAFGVLAWLLRDLREPEAWRAVAASFGVAWGLGGIVVAVALAAGLVDGRGLAVVALQAAFAVAWLLVAAGAAGAPAVLEARG